VSFDSIVVSRFYSDTRFTVSPLMAKSLSGVGSLLKSTMTVFWALNSRKWSPHHPLKSQTIFSHRMTGQSMPCRQSICTNVHWLCVLRQSSMYRIKISGDT